MKYRYLFLLLLILFSVPLYARMNGRIGTDRTPYLITDIGMKWSEFTYNAPVYDYVAFDFGLAFDGHVNPGLSAGLDFQWLDTPKVAGIVRNNFFFLLNHQVTSLFLGGFVEASLTAGPKISGFSASVRGTVSWEPKVDTTVFLETKVGAYVQPHDLLVISVLPGFGYSFLNDSYFFFTFEVGVQVSLWN